MHTHASAQRPEVGGLSSRALLHFPVRVYQSLTKTEPHALGKVRAGQLGTGIQPYSTPTPRPPRVPGSLIFLTSILQIQIEVLTLVPLPPYRWSHLPSSSSIISCDQSTPFTETSLGGNRLSSEIPSCVPLHNPGPNSKQRRRFRQVRTGTHPNARTTQGPRTHTGQTAPLRQENQG